MIKTNFFLCQCSFLGGVIVCTGRVPQSCEFPVPSAIIFINRTIFDWLKYTLFLWFMTKSDHFHIHVIPQQWTSKTTDAFECLRAIVGAMIIFRWGVNTNLYVQQNSMCKAGIALHCYEYFSGIKLIILCQ